MQFLRHVTQFSPPLVKVGVVYATDEETDTGNSAKVTQLVPDTRQSCFTALTFNYTIPFYANDCSTNLHQLGLWQKLILHKNLGSVFTK